MNITLSNFIIFQYPAYFVIFCLLLGLGYAFFFYYRNNFTREGTLWKFPTILMFSFRTIAVFLIALLLLAPLFRSLTRIVEEPVIAFLTDNSASMILNQDSVFMRDEFPQKLSELKEALDGDYSVQHYTFSTETVRDGELTFDERGTHIAGAIEHLSRRYYGRNLGAVVLTTDGIYNQGSNPVFLAEETGVPYFTIAAGDTIPPRDLRILDILHNRVVYAGNEFQVRVRINADYCANENVTLTVSHNGETIDRHTFTIDDEAFYKDIDLYLKAEEPGLKRYDFHLTELEDEINYQNNSRAIITEVMESRRQILLLSGAPHPDIQAIRHSIERQERFEVTHLPWHRNEELISNIREKLAEHSLVILHDLPGSNAQDQQLMEAIDQSGIPVFMILGPGTDLRAINQLNAGFTAERNRSLLDVTGSFTGRFNYFHLPDATAELIKRFPPLQAPASSFTFTDENQVMIESRDRRRGQIDHIPVVFFVNRPASPTGVINGMGIWRWFMHGFRHENSHRSMDDMIYQAVQFLSADRERERFRVHLPSPVFSENERIQFTAEFFNEAFQPIVDAEIRLELEDEDERVYDYRFRPERDYYVANIGNPGPGNYSYRAYTEYGGETFATTGEIAVEELDIETTDLVARHRLLREIAGQTGGEFVYPADIHAIASMIRQRDEIVSVSYREHDYSPVIHQHWLFFIIIALLSSEWFMRKYFGAY
jgi:hypothetical protein